MAAYVPTVGSRRLAVELRQLRNEAALTWEQAADALGWPASKLSRVEADEVRVPPRDVRRLLDLYRVDGERRAAVHALSTKARERNCWHRYGETLPGWFRFYAVVEAEASAIRSYEPQFIPGLLQTADYARALLRTLPMTDAAEAERHVTARMDRQALLTRDRPSRLWTVLDEATLRRQVGGPAVLRMQLDRLLEVGELPHITIQVLPFSAGAHPGTRGGFALLSFPEPAVADLAYVEYHRGSLYLEKSRDVHGYTLAFDELRAMALGHQESRALIAAAAR